MEVINRFGVGAGIKAVGSFNVLLKIIGKETLYDILVQHGFDPVFKIVTSRFDVPRELYYLKIYSSLSGFLNQWGPMFLFTIDNKHYLYQDQNGLKIFIGEYDDLIDDSDQDGIIDEDILDHESLKIPQIHSKYLNYISDARLIKIKKEQEYKKLLRDKYEYYTGKSDSEVYKIKPFDLKILKHNIL